LSLAEIGVLCGCSKVAVYQSVEAVRKKFINFSENRLNE
ncbi:sigma-70 family RNA polymerase sigma factor, partial [[Clostridium] innocuum]|nr:sigma-70 family RNA polymerase sigma factor [[Clostridium] innocuum]